MLAYLNANLKILNLAALNIINLIMYLQLYKQEASD